MFFCRVTQMSLLRLLTNRAAMGPDTRTPNDAFALYEELLRNPRVSFAPEPAGIEKIWLALMAGIRGHGNEWTDAYLASFAQLGNYCLVTFDRGMKRWPNVDVLDATT